MGRRVDTEAMACGLGKVVFMAWSLLLGPIGALTLLGIAYSMVTHNVVLGFLCGMMLACPFLSGLAWAILTASSILRSSVPGRKPAAQMSLADRGI